MKNMLFVLLVVVFFVGISYSPSTSTQVSDGLVYHGTACILKNGVLQGSCTHNIVVDGGRTMVQQSLGLGVNNTINQLAIGNSSAPSASDVALASEWSSCGLSKAVATYSSNGVGSWNMVYTWTSACDNVFVNTTALYKNGGALFAGLGVTPTTFQTNDKVTINYTLAINNG